MSNGNLTPEEIALLDGKNVINRPEDYTAIGSPKALAGKSPRVVSDTVGGGIQDGCPTVPWQKEKEEE